MIQLGNRAIRSSHWAEGFPGRENCAKLIPGPNIPVWQTTACNVSLSTICVNHKDMIEGMNYVIYIRILLKTKLSNHRRRISMFDCSLYAIYPSCRFATPRYL